MISIQVQSLPIDEVIQDIASALDADYKVICDEYILEIPEKHGSGKIKGINFNRGLGLIQYNCTFKEDIEIQFVVDDVHPVKFIFCLKGDFYHRFENSEEENHISQFQNAIVASQNSFGHIFRVKANTEVCINSVEVIRALFEERLRCDMDDLDENLLKLFKDKTGNDSFYYEGFYSLIIANTLKNINNYAEERFLRNLFLEGKTYLVLAQQILQYKDDKENGDQKKLIRQSEIKLIEKAANHIHHSLSNLGTITEIAAQVGVNPNKLQMGFQELYGETVNDFIKRIRLNTATTLLTETDYSMLEIQDRIGISSKSYFSKIFKDHYGISPSKFRQDNKEALRKRKDK
ncbi:helix-turn-helix transcriptional regulator [Galbibacter mesophilus]|uniref:helix-turn-helix transcriptional regulator n=1 Tax=Galbibacter mesophilus TaxID=379069 RepID=UPI00191E0C1C|nr:helix-turn-helix transcriptional regulator [Galbibacter mesophilus]MCM5661580.1 helix-turn-helix transcriptional regulator [Galbibacter mesophilus]